MSISADSEASAKTISRAHAVPLFTEGQITASGETLKSKDQARIDTDAPLVLKAQQRSELILIDVPSCKGWGYSSEILKGQKK